MGVRGYQPEPLELKIAKGTAKPEDIENAPTARKGSPKCPAWLPSGAKKVWREIIPELEHMGVLHMCDRHALAAYCITWDRYKQAIQHCVEHGELHENSQGTARSPMHMASDNLLKMARMYQHEFGLTPAARSSVKISGGKGKTNLEKFMQKGFDLRKSADG